MAMIGHRLITLKLRLKLDGFSSSGFKRRLRAFKRFEKIRASILNDVFPQNVSLPLHFFRGAEVDQVTDGALGDVHVVEQLLLVLGQDRLNGFQLRHDCAVNQQIRDVAFLQLPAFIVNPQGVFRRKRDTLVGEFHLQTFLVDFLAHARAHFFVNFKNRAHQSVAFVAKIFSVVSHRIEVAHYFTSTRPDCYRLITLNGRLILGVLSSHCFKRSLSEFKRSDNFCPIG